MMRGALLPKEIRPPRRSTRVRHPSVVSWPARSSPTSPNRDRDIAHPNQLASNSHEKEDGDGISIDGQRTNALLTQVDGVDFNSPLFGSSTGAENRSFFQPQTVIREFQIVSSGISAEVGTNQRGPDQRRDQGRPGNKLATEKRFYTVHQSALTAADAFGNSLQQPDE